MTPAVTSLKKAAVAFTMHRYNAGIFAETDEDGSYGERVASAVGLAPERVFKTLIAVLHNGEMVVAIVPVDRLLDLRSLARAASSKQAKMADPGQAEKATGYVTGGISPFGQKQSLRIYVDRSAASFASVCVSGGRRGLQLELSPGDLIEFTRATVADLTRG